MTIALTATQESKIRKLAEQAGITVPAMFKQVLKYGLPAVEEYFAAERQADADIKAGRTYTTEQVFDGGRRKKAA